MKRFLLFALVATMFASCVNDLFDQDGGSDKMPITISVEQTRANDVLFERGDSLGLYVVSHDKGSAATLADSGNHVDNMRFTLSSTWTPDETIYWKSKVTKADFYAYYPYGYPSNVSAYPFSVNSDQSNEADYWASDFLWGKRSDVSPTPDAVAIQTEHVFSNAMVYVVAGEGVTAEELASNIEVKICNVKTSANIDLSTGVATATGSTGEVIPWNTGEYYRAMIVPQTVSSNDVLLSVKLYGVEYTHSTNIEFKANTRHKITVTVNAEGLPSNSKFLVTFNIKEWAYDLSDYGGTLEKEEEYAKRLAGYIAKTLVTNNIYGNNFHDDFGYPSVFWQTEHAIGELFPSNWYSGGNQYYDRAHYFTYQIGLGPNGYCGLIWYNYYNLMRSVNELIKICRNNSALTVERGIAKTFRALYYLDLARFYDPLYAVSTERPSYMSELEAVKGLTVPMVDENTTNEIASNNPRLPREKMFQLIFNDLNDAEKSLATYVQTAKDMPSLAVVYGLKARAYLWLGGFEEGLYDTAMYPDVVTGNAAYAKAAEYARKAITASGCQPLTESEYCDPISGFCKINNAWMWGMIQSAETILSNLHSWAAHMCPTAGWGYGSGAQPGVRKKTYERMSNTDFRKKLIVGPNTTYADYKDVTDLTEEQWTTFGLEGTGIHTYCHLKFRTNGEKVSSTTGNIVDIPMMRVEEMYFIEAEATAHYDAATGKQLITSFMTSFRDPKYAVPVGNDLVEEIIFQKRCEFWGEGVLFFDFKRLDMGIDNAYEGTNAPVGADFYSAGRCPIWNICIPAAEVTKNAALEGKNNPDPSETLRPGSEMM